MNSYIELYDISVKDFCALKSTLALSKYSPVGFVHKQMGTDPLINEWLHRSIFNITLPFGSLDPVHNLKKGKKSYKEKNVISKIVRQKVIKIRLTDISHLWSHAQN